jgi:hypothetical protein
LDRERQLRGEGGSRKSQKDSKEKHRKEKEKKKKRKKKKEKEKVCWRLAHFIQFSKIHVLAALAVKT